MNKRKKRKMLTDCVNLMEQWDYSRNESSPETLSAGSGSYAWWLCGNGHSWQATVNHRHHGTGCPVCLNKIVIKGVNDLKTVNPALAAEWNYDKNGTLTPEDVPNGTHRKVWWLCFKGHEWEATILSRVAGTGCPYCSGLLPIKGETDFATVHPELAAQFDTSKNQGITASGISYASNKKYWWLCELGHSWKAGANTRHSGSGCPVCSGKIVLTGFNDLLTLNPTLAGQWDYGKNTLKPSEVSLHSDRHVWWLCEKGHSWNTRVAGRQRGSGCPYCSGLLAIPGETDFATVIPELLAEWDYSKNKNRKPEQYSPQSNKKVWWICKKGHSWEAPVYRRYYGNGCPVCAGLVVVKGENDLQSLFPYLAAQWDYSQNRFKPCEVHAHSNKYAWWICSEGHKWKALINNRSGKNRGCPYCSGLSAIPGKTDLLTKCPNIALEWDYEKNTVDIQTVTEYSNKRAWWKCDKGHSWRVAVKARRKGNGCPYCSGKLPIIGETDLLTLAPHLEKEWDYTKNTKRMTDYTLKSNANVWWICERGHGWETQIYNRVIGCGCPRCDGKVIYSSKNVKG